MKVLGLGWPECGGTAVSKDLLLRKRFVSPNAFTMSERSLLKRSLARGSHQFITREGLELPLILARGFQSEVMTTHHSRWLWLTSFAPQRKYIADVMLHSLGISDRSHFSPVVSVASDEKLAMFTLQTPTLPNIVYCVVYMVTQNQSINQSISQAHIRVDNGTEKVQLFFDDSIIMIRHRMVVV